MAIRETAVSLTPTLIILITAATLFGAVVYLDRRPYAPGQIWKGLYPLAMGVLLIIILVFLAHLVSLVTGTPVRSRYGF